jgi:DNA-binding NtrC family response regulator
VLRKQREEIQLVLLDVIMPAMGGLEAYAAIKEIKPSVRVILTTGHAAQAFTTDAMPRNVPFLRKPYSPRTLSQIIRSTLDSKPPHDFS